MRFGLGGAVLNEMRIPNVGISRCNQNLVIPCRRRAARLGVRRGRLTGRGDGNALGAAVEESVDASDWFAQ